MEGIARWAINKFLAPYLKNVSGKDVKLKKGNIELRNIQIKEDALNGLDLPIEVRFGLVELIHVKIPWTNLKGKSTVIRIENVYAIVQSRSEFVYNEETERKRLAREKNSAVEAFENRVKTAIKGDIVQKKKLIDFEKMGMKFITNIIDNLIVDIRNIHFRYVDKTSFSQCPFVLGACIESIRVPFVPNTGSKTKRSYVVKELSISGLSLYTYMCDNTSINFLFDKSWDHDQFKASMCRIFQHVKKTDAALKRPSNMTQWHARLFDFYQHYNPAKLKEAAFFDDLLRTHKGKEKQLLDMLVSKYGPEPPNIGPPMFVLHPLSVQVRFKFNKDTNRKASPLIELDAQLGTLAPRSRHPSQIAAASTSMQQTVDISLTPSQFGAVVAMAESLTNYRKYAKYRQFRPRRTDTQRCIRPDKSQRVPPVPGCTDPTRPNNPMARKWWSYAIQAIIIGNRQKRRRRSWLRVFELIKIRKRYVHLYQKVIKGKSDNKTHEKLDDLEEYLEVEEITHFRELARRGSELEHLAKRHSRKRNSGRPSFSGMDNAWDELTAAIDSSCSDVAVYESKHADDQVAKVKLGLSLSLALLTGEGQEVLVANINQAKMDLLARSKYLQMNLSVKDIVLKDHITENPVFPKIMCKAECDPVKLTGPEPDLICFSLHTKAPDAPKDDMPDVKVNVRTEPLDISLNMPFVFQLLEFFEVKQPLNLKALQEMVLEKVGIMQQQSAAQLQDALRDSANIELDVILQIGQVLVPQNPRDRTAPMIIVDLGIVTASMGGSHHATQFKHTSKGEVQAYQQISAGVSNMRLDVLPTCDRIVPSHHVLDEIVIQVDVLVAVGIASPEIPNVFLNIGVEKIAGNMSPFDFQNLLGTIFSVVSSIPTKYLTPDKEIVARQHRRDLATSSAQSKNAHANPRQRIHELEVSGLPVSGRALKLLQDDKIMSLDVNVKKLELALLEEGPEGTMQRMFLASVNETLIHIEPRYSNVDLKLCVRSLVLEQQLAEGKTLSLLSMLDFSQGNLFEMNMHVAQPAAADFADAEADAVLRMNLKALRLVYSRPAFGKLIPFFIANLPAEKLKGMDTKLKSAKKAQIATLKNLEKETGLSQVAKAKKNTVQIESTKKFAMHTDVAGIQIELFVEEAQKNLGVVNVTGVHFSLADHTTRLAIGGHLDGLRIRDCSPGATRYQDVLRCGSYDANSPAPFVREAKVSDPESDESDSPVPFVRETKVSDPETNTSATTTVATTTITGSSKHLVSFDLSLPVFKNQVMTAAKKAAALRDMVVSVQITSIHCCVLGRFVTDAARFFLGGALMMAIKELKPALEAMAPDNKDKIQAPQGVAPVQLAELPFPKLDFALTDVSLQVPRHSYSDERLQLSLEAVTLSNMESNLDLAVGLKNLRFEALDLKDRSVPPPPIFEVTSIEVDVSIAETLVVKADLKPITIKLDSAEITFITDLQENLKEKPVMVFDTPVPFDPPPKPSQPPAEIPDIGSNLDIHAVIGGFAITYSRMEKPAGPEKFLVEKGLAYFCLGALEAKALLKDGFTDIKADVSLSHIVLKDQRPYEAIAKDSMQRKVLETDPDQPFLKASVELKMAKTEDKTEGGAPPQILSVRTKAKFGGLTIVISDFGLDIVDSFCLTPFDGLPKHLETLGGPKPEAIEAAASEEVSAASAASVEDFDDDDIDDPLAVLGNFVLEEFSIPQWNIYLRRELLEHESDRYSVCFVALWENIAISASINGLCDIDVALRLTGLRVGIATLGEPLASVKMDSEGDSLLSRDILQPFNLCLSVKSRDLAPDGGPQAPHVKVILGTEPLRVFMSFYIVEQVMAMLDMVKQTAQRFDDRLAQEDVGSGSGGSSPRRPRSSILSAALKASDIPEATTDPATAIATEQDTRKLFALLRKIRLSTVVDVSEISACVLVDTQELRLGLVVRVLGLKGELQSSMSGFTIKCGVSIGSDVNMGSWAPLIEPWSLDFDATIPYSALTGDEAEREPMEISLTTQTMLNINLRQNNLMYLIRAIPNFVDSFESKKEKNSKAKPQKDQKPSPASDARPPPPAAPSASALPPSPKPSRALPPSPSSKSNPAMAKWKRERLAKRLFQVHNVTGMDIMLRAGRVFSVNHDTITGTDWGKTDMSWQTVRRTRTDPVTLMIPDLSPPPGVIIDTQLEIVFDIDARQSTRKQHKTLVPHVLTHYDFTKKTGNSSVCEFPIVPQAPQVFDIEIEAYDCDLKLMMKQKLLDCKTIDDVRKQMGISGSNSMCSFLKKQVYIVFSSDADIPVQNAAASLHKLFPGDVLLKMNGLDPVLVLKDLQETTFKPDEVLRFSVLRLAREHLRREGRRPTARVWLESLSGNFFRVRSGLSIRNTLSVPIELKLVKNDRETRHVLHPFDPDAPTPDVDNSRYFFNIPDMVENHTLYYRPLAGTGSSASAASCAFARVGHLRTFLAGHLPADELDSKSKVLEGLVDGVGQISTYFKEQAFYTVVDLRKDEIGTQQLSIVAPFSIQNLLPVPTDIRLKHVPAGTIYKHGTEICNTTLRPAQERATHEVSRSQRRFCVLQLACSACKFPGWSACDRDSCLDLRNTLHGEQYTTISLQDRDGQQLRVNVVMEGADGSVLHMRLFIYVSFWVINRTGIHLLYAEAKQRKAFNSIGLKEFAGDEPELAASLAQSSPAGGSSKHNTHPETLTLMQASNSKQTKVNLRAKPAKEDAWSPLFDVSSLHRSTKERNNGLISSKGKKKHYQFVYRALACPSSFFRTTVIQLTPRFYVVNKTKYSLDFQQVLTKDAVVQLAKSDAAGEGGDRGHKQIRSLLTDVPFRVKTPMYFYSESYGCLRILPHIRQSDPSSDAESVDAANADAVESSVSADATPKSKAQRRESTWEWSNVFSPFLVGEHILTVFHQDGDLTLTRYFAIDVAVQQHQTCVTVRDVEKQTDVPYRIDNDTTTHYLQIVQHLPELDSKNTGNQSRYMVAPLNSMMYAPQHPMEPPIVDILLLVPAIVNGSVQFAKVGSVTKDLRKLHTARSALSDTIEKAAEISPADVKSSLKHPSTLATGSVCMCHDPRTKEDPVRCVLLHLREATKGKWIARVQLGGKRQCEVPVSYLRPVFQYRVELDSVQRVLHVRSLTSTSTTLEMSMELIDSHVKFIQECLQASQVATRKHENVLAEYSGALKGNRSKGLLSQVFFDGIRACGLLQEHLDKLTEWRDGIAKGTGRKLLRQLSGDLDDDNTNLSIKMMLKGVGISIMNYTEPREEDNALPSSQRPSPAQPLIFLSLRDIHLNLDIHRSRKMCLELKLFSIQLDNQTRSLFPVVLSREAQSFKLFRKRAGSGGEPSSPKGAATPTPPSPASPAPAAEEEERKPMLFIGLCQLPVDHDRATMIESLNILLQGVDINIDTEFLNSVLRFLVILDSNLTREKPQAKQLEDMRHWIVKSNNIDDIQKSNHQLIFGILQIQPIKINISFQTVGDTLQKDNFVSKQIGALRQIVNFLLTFSDVEATLRIKGYAQEAVYSTPETLGTILQNFYVSQLAKESYKVMGGLKLFGNPTKLISNVGTGVVSLFYEPGKGAMSSPKDFAKGFASGGYEFVAGVSTGVLGTVSSIIDSTGGFLSKVTLDDDYQHRRKAAPQPKNVGAGALSAGKQVGMGLFHGLTGLVTRPIQRVKEGKKKSTGKAVGGFFRGMWEGVAGLAIKPVLGVTDGVRDLMDGASHSIRKEEQVPRIRSPRLLLGFPVSVACTYNAREAQAQRWLQILRAKVPNLGQYVFHAEVEDHNDRFLLLTDQRMVDFYCRLKEDRKYGSNDKLDIFFNINLSEFWGSDGVSCTSEKVCISSTKRTVFVVCRSSLSAQCLVAGHQRLSRQPPFSARDYHYLRCFMRRKEQSIVVNCGVDAKRLIETGRVTISGAVIVAHEIHTERKFMGRKHEYVRFRIRVMGKIQNNTNLEWTVERRWNKFQELRKSLSKKNIWPETLYKKHLKGHGWSKGTGSDEIQTRKSAFSLILAELKPFFGDVDIVKFLTHDARVQSNAMTQS